MNINNSELIGDNYYLGEKIGEGSFGKIYFGNSKLKNI